MSNSKPVIHLFNKEAEPKTTPPNMGYFDENKANTENSASTLKSLLQGNCNISKSDLLTPNEPDKFYTDTITGNINEDCGITSVKGNTDSVNSAVNTNCESPLGKERIINHIKYLACQLAFARNRTYNSADFDVFNSSMSVKDVFDKFANLRMVMYLIFLLSIYFLVQGFLSSFDVATNMMNLVEENSSKSIVYYVSLGFGVAIPVLILCIFFVRRICGNLETVEKWNITDKYDGGKTKEKINSGFKNLDYSVLMIFLFLIYGLVVALFVISKESLGPTMYTLIVSSIFFIISIFLYIFYNFIPFFATANIKNYGKDDIDLKLYIDDEGRRQPGNISSNQAQIQNLQKVFIQTAMVIVVFFIIYIAVSKKLKDVKGLHKDVFSGFFGASAILMIPIVWVVNFILSTKYFYTYPLVLLGFRFLRYAGMALLYGQYSYAQEYGIEGFFSGDGFSDDLKEQLENFSDYSPSWNLVGIDFVKTCLNLFGYENLFSKKFTNENKSNNLASNRYVIPGIFSYLGKDKDQDEDLTKNKLTVQVIIILITALISYILLKVVYKV